MYRIKKHIVTIIAGIFAMMMILTGCGAAKSLETLMIYDEMVRIKSTNDEMKARKERLNRLLAEAEQRHSDLEDEEAYAQQRKYIEEKARSIGYVYPDEIVFQEDDD